LTGPAPGGLLALFLLFAWLLLGSWTAGSRLVGALAEATFAANRSAEIRSLIAWLLGRRNAGRRRSVWPTLRGRM